MAQSPSPSPPSVDFSFPGPAPTRPPEPPRDPPYPVPAPQAEATLPAPPIPPHLPNASTPDPTQALKAIPNVEVWRAGANASQKTPRHGRQLGRGFIAGNAPVLVQLRFDPSQAGKTVAVSAGRGITFEPPMAFVQIRPTGDCALTVKLDEAFHEGSMTFVCDGMTSLLRLSRAPLSLVSSLETSSP